MKKLLHTLQTVTGMGVAVFDTHFRCVHFTSRGISFCREVHRSERCHSLCKQSDQAALERVRNTKRPYINRCPFGLFEAVYPILEQERLLGYLLISPALCKGKDPQSYCVEQVLRRHPETSHEALLSAVQEIPVYTEEELDAICHTVSLFTEHIGSNHLISGTELPLGELIKQYVKKNLGSKITLSAMSQDLHCSTVTLTETFRREYGVTIMKYVLQKRMKLAEGMLADPNSPLTVTEVADRCGFPDVEYFSKKFKETHGIPPTVWRARPQNQE